MRYTTIIDISEQPTLYRNHNARLLYLHMCLKSGYHDEDRDMLDASIRQLADQTGITVSATRHALELLLRSGLLKRVGHIWSVRKWIVQAEITPRPKTAKQQKQLEAAAQAAAERDRRQQEQQVEELRRTRLWQEGKTDFMLYYEAQYKKALAGDQEAQAVCRKNKAMYDEHRKQFEARKGGAGT